MPAGQFRQDLKLCPHGSMSKSSLTFDSPILIRLVTRVEEVEGSQTRAAVEEHRWMVEVVEGHHLVEAVVHQRIAARKS